MKLSDQILLVIAACAGVGGAIVFWLRCEMYRLTLQDALFNKRRLASYLKYQVALTAIWRGVSPDRRVLHNRAEDQIVKLYDLAMSSDNIHEIRLALARAKDVFVSDALIRVHDVDVYAPDVLTRAYAAVEEDQCEPSD